MVDTEEEKDAKREKAKANHEYYQKNKEKIQAQQCEYRLRNKEKLSAQQRERYQQNREERLTYASEYRSQNREELLTKQREYRSQNQEEISTKRREYYQQNPEKTLARNREYYQQNREKVLEHNHKYRSQNREKVLEQKREYRQQNHPGQFMSENKDCPLYLGVHVAERVLSKIFNDVERMPMHNPGFDFICQKGYKVDVKASTLRLRGDNSKGYWGFHTLRNTVADYFLCLAFMDRESLEPVHLWLIPSDVVSDRVQITISQNRLDKWSEYELPDKLDDVKDCCIKMR